MDPITQGLFGALAVQTTAQKKQLGKASLIGAIGGMVPDLDVLIRSGFDPLLYLEYHRHFTHSLFFIPIGGVLCGFALFFLLGKLWQLTLKNCLLWSTLGFATHGLLDACTSYGTRLLWPVSDSRIAWDLMSIIDPIFSGILLVLVLVAAFSRKKAVVIGALCWLVSYFSLAGIQHYRAISWGNELAENRGHIPTRLSAKPSFGNILIWKIIYETDGIFYVSAVKPGFGEAVSWDGDSIPKLDIDRDFPWLDRDSQQARDIERFRIFSTDYLGVDPDNPMRIGDIRYSPLPQHIQPLWGIELSTSATVGQHVKYITQRGGNSDSFEKLLEMLQR